MGARVSPGWFDPSFLTPGSGVFRKTNPEKLFSLKTSPDLTGHPCPSQCWTTSNVCSKQEISVQVQRTARSTVGASLTKQPRLVAGADLCSRQFLIFNIGLCFRTDYLISPCAFPINLITGLPYSWWRFCSRLPSALRLRQVVSSRRQSLARPRQHTICRSAAAHSHQVKRSPKAVASSRQRPFCLPATVGVVTRTYIGNGTSPRMQTPSVSLSIYAMLSC